LAGGGLWKTRFHKVIEIDPDPENIAKMRIELRECGVKPALVAQVKFTEWTHDYQLRQPVFLGLRTDKDVKDIVRD